MSSSTPPAGHLQDPALVLAAGSRPLPDYELKGILGRGGFGEVWIATGPGGFDVALKFVRLEGSHGDVERRSLETIKGLRHAHLLPVFGSWQLGGFLIVAMELADGTLLDRLNEHRKAGLTGIPQDELIQHMRDAARGLDFLAGSHPLVAGGEQFFQHRDVKPQNLLLVGGAVKVADFGLARALEHASTQASSKMTPAYAAPEMFHGRISLRSDQYSLAVSFCLLRGGRLPFDGPPAQMMAGHILQPPDLTMLPAAERAVVAMALAKEPQQRFESSTAFVAALAVGGKKAPLGPRGFEESRTPTLPQNTPAALLPEPTPPTLSAGSRSRSSATRRITARRPQRRAISSAIWLVVGALFLLLAGLVAWPWLFPKKPDRPAEPTDKRGTIKQDMVGPPKLHLILPAELALTVGESQALAVQVVRTNWPGPIALRLVDIPAGLTVKDGRIEAEQAEGKLQLSAEATAAAGTHTVQLVAEAGGVRDTAQMRLVVSQKPALALRVAKEMTLTAGESQPLRVDVERTNCKGSITLRAERLDAGLSANDGRIEGWQSEGMLRLSASSTMPAGESTVRIVAEAEGVKATADVRVLVTKQRQDPLGMKFVKLPKGTFYMGGGGGMAGKKKEIEADFEIAIHSVTQEQWAALMDGEDKNPSKFRRGGEYAERVEKISEDELKRFPVENVSWDVVKVYITKLNEREKGSGWTYRLPTEAEWEYACRGGATTEEECSYHFYFAKPTNDLSSEQANFDGNNPIGNTPKGEYLMRPTKVGSYPPNKLGLYDMHGNVWQWCSDLYEPGGSVRVIRGGGWGNGGSDCRASGRDGSAPSGRSDGVGF